MNYILNGSGPRFIFSQVAGKELNEKYTYVLQLQLSTALAHKILGICMVYANTYLYLHKKYIDNFFQNVHFNKEFADYIMYSRILRISHKKVAVIR